jgi:hypothetical protein
MAFGQIAIQSLQQSHIEPLELGQERNFARQRAKVVVVEGSVFKFSMRNNSNGTSVRPMLNS